MSSGDGSHLGLGIGQIQRAHAPSVDHAAREAEPTQQRELSAISGVGPRKLSQYADQVLAVVGGADPDEVAATAVGEGEE